MQNYLEMSAKSSNFAQKLIDNEMKANEIAEKMTHTPYRCRFSVFARSGENLVCTKALNCGCDIDCVTKCKDWRPSKAVQDVVEGVAGARQRKIILDIMKDRIKAGTF